MSSTNKTTNYELSQYVGSDKPTYLGDYNSDMLKIDTQMKANADSASSAYSLASTAKSTADDAETHAQTALTNASTADGKAVNAQTTASSANLTAQQALSVAQSFNLTVFEPVDNSDITYNIGNLNTSVTTLTIAKSADGSLAKIYGTIRVGFSNTSGTLNVSFPSSLRPSSNITIQCACLRKSTTYTTYYNDNTVAISLNLATDGTISVTGSVGTDFTTIDFYFLPCLYWIKDFGDVPSNPD